MDHRLTSAALVAAGFLLTPTAAYAVEITSPPDQSGVSEGTTVVVAGRDCPSGEPVRVFFSGVEQEAVSTTSGADGSWSVGLPVPTLRQRDVLEAAEQSLVAECAGERDAALVVYRAAPDGDEELPYTGPADVTRTAALGALLVAAGAGAALAGRSSGTQAVRASAPVRPGAAGRAMRKP